MDKQFGKAQYKLAEGSTHQFSACSQHQLGARAYAYTCAFMRYLSFELAKLCCQTATAAKHDIDLAELDCAGLACHG